MTTIAVPQMAVDDLDPGGNLGSIAGRVEALPDRVEVALFPEYALTGFVADDRLTDVALDRDGPELARLADLAASNDLGILAGYVERGESCSGTDEAPLYNALAYVAPDGETTVSRKRHLWGRERDHLTPGEERVVVETPAGPTGLVTCYDLNFVADSAAFTRDRVDALFVAGAWPAAHTRTGDSSCVRERWTACAGLSALGEPDDVT